MILPQVHLSEFRELALYTQRVDPPLIYYLKRLGLYLNVDSLLIRQLKRPHDNFAVSETVPYAIIAHLGTRLRIIPAYSG
jgi:hypothetical protein